MKTYSVVLTQTKVIEIDVKAKTADIAAQVAKTVEAQEHNFDKRLGSITVARIKEVEDE